MDSLQISFKEFKKKLLEPGLVDHIVVSNKSVAQIYVKSTPHNQTDGELVQETLHAEGSGGQFKYFFNIGSIESFEEKLEEAQDALGIDPDNYIPVTYSSEMVWYLELMRFVYQELVRFSPTLLLLGSLLYFKRKMKAEVHVGGNNGGDNSDFNKAKFTKVDKNAKNKVCSFLILLYMRWLLFFHIF